MGSESIVTEDFLAGLDHVEVLSAFRRTFQDVVTFHRLYSLVSEVFSVPVIKEFGLILQILDILIDR